MGSTKEVVLRFDRKQLLYDIGQWGWLDGDVMQVDDDHARHQVQDVTQDGNVDLVTRILTLEFSRIVERLRRWTQEAVEDGRHKDDELREREWYVLRLRVDEEFTEGMAEKLEQVIHHLLVWRVLWRWSLRVNPAAAASYEAQASELDDELRGVITPRVLTRRQSPF